jgi:hypothetical protein
MSKKQFKLIFVLSLFLTAVLTVVSYYGAFNPGTYERETPSMAAQGMGQDIVDLFLIVPLLVVSSILILKNNKFWFFIFGGTVLYILYSFVIYSFGVHFNQLFLLYCFTLGLSLYVFILFIYQFNKLDVLNWFGNRVAIRPTAIYLIFVALMFYFLWFKDIIPATLNHTIPKTVSDYNLLVNPVHVLDISFALPGLIISALLMIKKHRLGYILAPISLVFIFNLAIALSGMVIMLKVKGIGESISIAVIFIILAIISLVFLVIFLKNIKSNQI